jgi:hypothetical protein
VQEDEPVWVKREKDQDLRKAADFELPFGVYLLFSSFVAIAAVRSCHFKLLSCQS